MVDGTLMYTTGKKNFVFSLLLLLLSCINNPEHEDPYGTLIDIDGNPYRTVQIGNQVWMTNAPPDGKKLYAVCLDLDTGKVIHDRLVFDNPDPQFCIHGTDSAIARIAASDLDLIAKVSTDFAHEPTQQE